MPNCTNCGRSGARPRSFDLDLPALQLCDMCAVLITLDPEMFEEMGRRAPADH